jgi:hypothetical protein
MDMVLSENRLAPPKNDKRRVLGIICSMCGSFVFMLRFNMSSLPLMFSDVWFLAVIYQKVFIFTLLIFSVCLLGC